ncbi:MAG: hypothetical protein BRD23_08830 [Halobacteriales archaeon SW_9_67_25]|jgi:hypothetical protein|nr:MAG: hypothetical protein BRD23_08830 [Halobacteriales archaeon SW_9_67_25]
MGLAEIAAGVEVTAEQRDRGVATVDRTDESLAERLAGHEKALPTSAETAATVLERYAAGDSVGVAAHRAGTAPVTAAKTLHLLGESVHPLGPTGREVVADWLAGDLPRTEALELARATETEFALAVYVQTHDPLADACAAVEDALAVRHRPDEDPLEETRSDAVDLL